MNATLEQPLVVKELADALGVGKHYVYQMRRCGFKMHGHSKDNQTATLSEALAWIKSNNFRPSISLRLTPDERRPIDDAINRSGLTQSDWAKKSLLYVATNNLSIA